MQDKHPYEPDVSFDGGDLDCGNGLLLLIRKHIDPLKNGELLEIRSRESSVEEDLPSWCRLTKNELVSFVKDKNEMSFLVSKGKFIKPSDLAANKKPEKIQIQEIQDNADSLENTYEESEYMPQEIKPFSVMGIGSWPRPAWLIRSLHEWISGQVTQAEFYKDADDGVRLAVQGQEEGGADVITDGEQRRDNYASFVGMKLDNCQLIPLTDLLPLVDDPEKFEAELNQLDVPASEVRHPAVFGKLKRSKPIVLDEVRFLKQITKKPVKVSLPGPYLLCRTMWMECISDMAYESREKLAEDIVLALREELSELIKFGVEIIQFDEPVLTEVVFSSPSSGRSFMCGALGEKLPVKEELDFASGLLRKVCKELPADRIGLHVCRGNWTRDESKALSGGYEALLPYFENINAGTLFLEHATSRAGSYDFIKELSSGFDLALGFVNQKNESVESTDQILKQAEEVLNLMGKSGRKLHLVPDCGFATFADSPISAPELAKNKLKALKSTADKLR